MTRKKTFKGARGKPAYGSQFEVLIQDWHAANILPYDEWLRLTPTPWIPLGLHTSAGGTLRMTQVGINAAYMVAETAFAHCTALRQQFTKKEFTNEAFRAIGDTLMCIRQYLPRITGELSDEEHGALAQALANDFSARLEDLEVKVRPDLVRHIPCSLFDVDQNVPTFVIGPVSFLPATLGSIPYSLPMRRPTRWLSTPGSLTSDQSTRVNAKGGTQLLSYGFCGRTVGLARFALQGMR